jgi:hypothetical protein
VLRLTLELLAGRHGSGRGELFVDFPIKPPVINPLNLIEIVKK